MPSDASAKPDAPVASSSVIPFPNQRSGLTGAELNALLAHCATLVGDVSCNPDTTGVGSRTAYLTSPNWGDNPAFMVECYRGRFLLWDARLNPAGVIMEDSADLDDILTVLTAEVDPKPVTA